MAQIQLEQGKENLERLLDLIAEAFIQSPYIDSDDVKVNQRTIRNGLVQLNRLSTDESLVLYQKDIKANPEDLQIMQDTEEGPIAALLNIANSIDFDMLDNPPIQILDGSSAGQEPDLSVSIMGGGLPGGGMDITQYVINLTDNADGGVDNPINISQFVSLEQSSSIVNVEQAEEFLDTNIFELLPSGDTRQARITRFFQELNALLPPTLPSFDEDDTPGVDRLEDGTWSGAEEYSQNNSSSYAQDNPAESNIDEEDAYFHRLKDTANSTNESKTIQDIYNRVLPYLDDLLESPVELEDMPTYQNKSSGYLKFRNPNQGIVIRNTNKEFVEGLDPNNLTYLNTDGSGGFTITMWVKFLDKSSQGTLFNFGNPTRNQPDSNWNGNVTDGFGFKLETFIVNKKDKTGYPTNDGRYDTFGDFSDYIRDQNPDTRPDGFISKHSGKAIFENTDSARFVRLVVNGYDNDGNSGWLRSSETGDGSFLKYSWNMPELPGNFNPDNNQWDELRALGCTHIPEDFNEWYFICATFNPNTIEPDRDDEYPIGVYDQTQLEGQDYYYGYDHRFWMNHRDVNTGQLVEYSGYGNQCKVEVISRSDLLRARGFKV